MTEPDDVREIGFEQAGEEGAPIASSEQGAGVQKSVGAADASSVDTLMALRERIESARDGRARMALVDEAASALAPFAQDALGEGTSSLEGCLSFLARVVAERDREKNRNRCSEFPLPEMVVDNREDETPVVSVIVPVYNAASFLRETLGSVLFQTLSSLEVICLDDGSTDNSLQILRAIARCDNRVAVYHQDNLGLSSTRNRAMRLARGRYIYFLDADDLLERDALLLLSERADADQLDIVYLDGQSFYDDESLIEKYPFFQTAYQRKGGYEGVWSGAELMAAFWGSDDLYVPPWLALFRRSFLEEHGIEFVDGIAHEDNAYYVLTALCAERVAHCPEKLIRRRVHDDSIMTKPLSFANALGYYCCALEMLRAYFKFENDMLPDTRAAVKAFAMRTLRSAATSLERVPECEWSAVYGLREDCDAMQSVVVAPAYVGAQRRHLRRDLDKARESVRNKDAELDELRGQLERLAGNIDALEDKLQGEIDVRRACESEIARLKASKSYRVGHALMRPFIALRRGVRQLSS